MTLGNLWNCHRDEMNDAANENVGDNSINNNKTTTRKFFEYKSKITGITPANNNAIN